MDHSGAFGLTLDNVFVYVHPLDVGVRVECVCETCNSKRGKGAGPEYMPDVERYNVLTLVHSGADPRPLADGVRVYAHPSGEPNTYVECICDHCSWLRRSGGRRATYWRGNWEGGYPISWPFGKTLTKP